MEKRQLGNSDLSITVLGYGAWAIGGGGWEFGWGPQDDRDSIGSIHEALDAGINWIDTAAIYGLGRSEEVVATALAEYKGERPLIFTKCSMRWDDNREIFRSLKADSVREELENSLRRLKTDTIDLYQIHWPNPADEIEEGWTEMAKLQQEGKIRYLGVSNFSVDQMKRAQSIAPVTSLQPPYSMLARDIEDTILPFCEQNNIGVIVYSPMRSGLLTGAMTRERIAGFPSDDWRLGNTDFQEPALTRNLELVEVLRGIGNSHNATAGDVAIAWTLRLSSVTAAIVGMRKPGQAAGVVGAATLRLSEAEIGEIEGFMASHPV
jgi:aryl-alcohol dehydrogenase-like predicted oxidoreductase